MKVAFCHDWLNGMRGGEKCLEALCELFPEAPIFTLFADASRLSGSLLKHPIHTSFLQRMPLRKTHYRHYLPLFPRAVESLDLREFDLVISTSHCVAKGVRKRPGAFHLCYCFTPMRYAWGFFEDYFGGRDGISRAAISWLLERLRRWDRDSSAGVDQFVAISDHIRSRIKRCYDRDAEVAYPPVNTAFYTPADGEDKPGKEDFYLAVSALVPYKRLDLAVEAFNRLRKPLTVVGEGPEEAALKRRAGPTVRMLGWQSDERLRDLYRTARALIFPGEEDFGIVTVEAQACGLPVIAYAAGGARETVREGETGVFFGKQTAESLAAAVQRFESSDWDPGRASAWARRFSRERFVSEMDQTIRRLLAKNRS